MIRILHLIAQKPDKTGSGIYLQGLLKVAGENGYDQALVCGVEKGETYSFQYLNPKNYYGVEFNSKELPFPILGMSDIMPYNTIKYSDLDEEKLCLFKEAFKKHLTKAISEFKPDIIISHHLWILTAYTKELFSDIPMVTICHGTDLRQLNLSPKYAEYVINGCKKVDNILVLSSFQKELIMRDFNIDDKKIHVVGSGYSKEIFFRSNIAQKEAAVDLIENNINVVYAGKLSFAKGVPSLLRTLDKLNYVKHKIKLTLLGAGTGKELQIIKEIASSCRYEVIFKGAVPQSELAEVFRASDLFILPSFYEGLPLVVIEALASGLRVVVTDLPGLNCFVGDELNSCGVIEYVKLPKMISVDEPHPNSIIDFEYRLKQAIDKQINNIINEVCIEDKSFNVVCDMCFEALFKKIEKILIKLI